MTIVDVALWAISPHRLGLFFLVAVEAFLELE
jgi:hypothetical protein